MSIFKPVSVDTYEQYWNIGDSNNMEPAAIGLLTLPAELRLRIYDYLPDLTTEKTVYVAAGNILTPHICRTNKILRQETIPLFAQNMVFWFSLAANPDPSSWLANAMTVWVNGLGDLGLTKLSKMVLSRHWELSKPTRNQAHVGFYLKLERKGSPNARGKEAHNLAKWETTVGTYPVANDMRGMRLESAKLLQDIVIARLESGHGGDEHSSGCSDILVHGSHSFTCHDLEFIIRAIDIVARHPFSTQDLDQDAVSKQRRRSVFEKMEQELLLLVAGHESVELRETFHALDGEDARLYSRR